MYFVHERFYYGPYAYFIHIARQNSVPTRASNPSSAFKGCVENVNVIHLPSESTPPKKLKKKNYQSDGIKYITAFSAPILSV